MGCSEAGPCGCGWVWEGSAEVDGGRVGTSEHTTSLGHARRRRRQCQQQIARSRVRADWAAVCGPPIGGQRRAGAATPAADTAACGPCMHAPLPYIFAVERFRVAVRQSVAARRGTWERGGKSAAGGGLGAVACVYVQRKQSTEGAVPLHLACTAGAFIRCRKCAMQREHAHARRSGAARTQRTMARTASANGRPTLAAGVSLRTPPNTHYAASVIISVVVVLTPSNFMASVHSDSFAAALSAHAHGRRKHEPYKQATRSA